MVVLPVVERELRVASRGRATYRVRFWAVLSMLGLFIWFMKTSGLQQNTSLFGQQMMVVLTIPAFVFSLFIGVLATSDCVSSEKREGTLGLLFLTDLKGYDVICGKLAANSLNAVYGLLAILPVLGMPVLLGGVTLAQFVEVAVVLFSTIALSLAVGIFVSTCSRNERKAMFFTVLLLLAAAGLPFILTEWISETIRPIPNTRLWVGFLYSPAFGIGQTLTPVSLFPAFSYWLSVLWQWLLALALIAWASARVPHSWDESGPKKKRRLRPLKVASGVKTRSEKGRAWLAQNPFLWLALHGDEAGPRRVWLFVSAILIVWGVASIKFGMHFMADEDMVTMTMFMLHTPLKIWIAAEASRRFSEDRSNHSFESLLATPLSASQIIAGQWLALFKQFAGPIAVVMIWETVMGMQPNSFSYWGREVTIGYWPRTVLLAADAGALAWVGMWLGLKCKGRIRAILASLMVVLFVPWVVTQVIMIVLLEPLRVFGVGNDGWKAWLVTATLAPSLFMDLLIMVWAVTRLPQNFRRLAVR